MHAHHTIIRALSDAHLADLVRSAERERAARRAVARARARQREREMRAFGGSLRLRDGRWVHLRHDSA